MPVTLKKKTMVPGQNGTSYNLSDRMSLRGAGLWSKTLSKTWRREVRPREGGQARQRNKGNTRKRDWKYNVTAENMEIFEMHNARKKNTYKNKSSKRPKDAGPQASFLFTHQSQ